MSIVIVPAEPRHVEAIARLSQEMDHYYGATEVEPAEQRIHQITEAIFTDPPSAQMILAFAGEEPIGFASYSFLWPAVGLTRSLYLKELYVTRGRRRAGVGARLMGRLFDIALRAGCSRVEWTTDHDNSDAQSFYKKLGMSVNSSKLFYRVEGEELHSRPVIDGDKHTSLPSFDSVADLRQPKSLSSPDP